MAAHFVMKTSKFDIQNQLYCQWRTRDQIQMDLNFSLYSLNVRGNMDNIQSLVK